jgi:hypothetical protein
MNYQQLTRANLINEYTKNVQLHNTDLMILITLYNWLPSFFCRRTMTSIVFVRMWQVHMLNGEMWEHVLLTGISLWQIMLL